MQGVFRRLLQGGVDALGQDAVEPGAFIDLVKMGEGLPSFDYISLCIANRGSLCIVKQPLGQVRSRSKVF